MIVFCDERQHIQFNMGLIRAVVSRDVPQDLYIGYPILFVRPKSPDFDIFLGYGLLSDTFQFTCPDGFIKIGGTAQSRDKIQRMYRDCGCHSYSDFCSRFFLDLPSDAPLTYLSIEKIHRPADFDLEPSSFYGGI